MATADTTPMVVFVYADWCGHCTNYKPYFNEYVDSQKQNMKDGKIGFVMYNFDKPVENKKIAWEDIGCQSFPCVQIYYKGRKNISSCKTNVSQMRN